MNLYKVRVSAVYCVESANALGARLKALNSLHAEITRCPENLNDYKTEVTLISEVKN